MFKHLFNNKGNKQKIQKANVLVFFFNFVKNKEKC